MAVHTRVHVDEKNVCQKLFSCVYKEMLALKYSPQQQLLILCVGTDRSTGDALGPLTGSLLLQKKMNMAQVMGNLEEPVHAANLKEKIKYIYEQHLEPFVVAIDAGLGKKKSVGCIDVKKGPLRPGTGVNKKLPEIGDLHITGLVNISGYMEYLVLQSTRLSLVLKMASIISQSIQQVAEEFEREISIIK